MIVRHFKQFEFALMVALVMFALAGCASSPRQATGKVAPKAKASAKQKSVTAKDGEYPEASEGAIQSYAHYAAGLSLDMREQQSCRGGVQSKISRTHRH